MFCHIARNIYNNISQLYLNCEIAKDMHTKMLPFIELQDEEKDIDCYNCESLVSSDESLSDSYKVGLEKLEELLKSKENKIMMNDVLTKEYKQQMKNNSIEKYNSLCQKLNLEENYSCVNDSRIDENEMCEISDEDEIDCSSFAKHVEEPKIKGN